MKVHFNISKSGERQTSDRPQHVSRLFPGRDLAGAWGNTDRTRGDTGLALGWTLPPQAWAAPAPPPYLSPESGRRPGRAWGCLARTALHTHTCAHVVLHTHVCTHAPAHTCTTLFKGPCGPLPGPWEPLSLGVWSVSGTSVTISNQGPCHREAGGGSGTGERPVQTAPQHV